MLQPVTALEWSLEVGTVLLLSIGHVHALRIHSALFSSERFATSFLGGVGVTYVFLFLFPEIDLFHESIGEWTYSLVLVGFLIFYGMEHASRRIELAGRSPISGPTIWMRLAFLWMYNALFVYTIPDRIERSEILFVVNTIAVGFHLVHVDVALARRDPSHFQRTGRWVLLSALIGGLTLDQLVPPSSSVTGDMLTALLAGFVVINVFRDELPDHERSDFRWFTAGIASYAGLAALRPILDVA